MYRPERTVRRPNILKFPKILKFSTNSHPHPLFVLRVPIAALAAEQLAALLPVMTAALELPEDVLHRPWTRDEGREGKEREREGSPRECFFIHILFSFLFEMEIFSENSRKSCVLFCAVR